MGKGVIVWLICLLLIGSCRKEKNHGKINETDFLGKWKLVEQYLDIDSNGLDIGDKILKVSNTDSIFWDFQNKSRLLYYYRGNVDFESKWGLTIPNRDENECRLYLNPDPDYDEAIYKINRFHSDSISVYTSKYTTVGSLRIRKHIGWVLTRQ